jgi:hypothetical protein
MFLIFGCTDNNVPAEKFHPHQKMTQLEVSIESPDPNWKELIRKQLVNDNDISEKDIEKLFKDSSYERCRVEYASFQEYNGEQYPYRFKAELIIWKSEPYFAVCSIADQSIEAFDGSFELSVEGPKQPWVENLVLPKVLSVGQSLGLTMGSRISFIKDGQKNGPFTVVQTCYIPYPPN